MKKGIQYITKEYLERCKGATPDQILEFLENYRRLVAKADDSKNIQKTESSAWKEIKPSE